MTDRSMDRHCICYCIEDELEKCITEEFSDKILYGEYPNKDGIIDEVVEEVVRATNLEADDNATWDIEDVVLLHDLYYNRDVYIQVEWYVRDEDGTYNLVPNN